MFSYQMVDMYPFNTDLSSPDVSIVPSEDDTTFKEYKFSQCKI